MKDTDINSIVSADLIIMQFDETSRVYCLHLHGLRAARSMLRCRRKTCLNPSTPITVCSVPIASAVVTWKSAVHSVHTT